MLSGRVSRRDRRVAAYRQGQGRGLSFDSCGKASAIKMPPEATWRAGRFNISNPRKGGMVSTTLMFVRDDSKDGQFSSCST
jgi:hypothetical protein